MPLDRGSGQIRRLVRCRTTAQHPVQHPAQHPARRHAHHAFDLHAPPPCSDAVREQDWASGTTRSTWLP
ncbi:hypothetical protein G6F40_016742 [Rhizopus arrhizus]|nr:hypothetical protein G6F40_016742 [Rhizopus arrhizus]